MISLKERRILLGVSGSIAAYKAADLCSRLGKLEAEIHVVLTAHAAEFVGVPTFRALTRNPVLIDIFDEPHAQRIAHIDLAQSADLVIVAPASANLLAKLAHGLADDMLTTCLLATPPTVPVLVAPAMNTVMWDHPATLANLNTLAGRGVQIVQPGYGVLACQDVGVGKLADVSEIVQAIVDRLTASTDYTGRRVLVTAGATREPLDPVRFLTNRSSGKMGYAIAAAAARRGAEVTLITAPTALPVPTGVHVVRVETAEAMCAASVQEFATADLFVGAAAVADYAPAEFQAQKIKKRTGVDDLLLHLRRTPDIAATLGALKRPGQITVGFAAETEALLSNAHKKIHAKQLDLIVANDVTAEGAGFESDTNIVTLLWPDGRSEALPKLTKHAVADHLLDAAHALLSGK